MGSINFSGVHAWEREKGERLAPSATRNAPAPRAHQWGPHVGKRAGLIERSARALAELVFRNWFGLSRVIINTAGGRMTGLLAHCRVNVQKRGHVIVMDNLACHKLRCLALMLIFFLLFFLCSSVKANNLPPFLKKERRKRLFQCWSRSFF
jgi:hypothetical protein